MCPPTPHGPVLLNTAISQMISPTPGSTLLGTSVTFTWTAGTDVSAHELLIGTTLGASNVTNATGLGTVTSFNATLVGAPPGATLYVRLRSLVGATLFFNDYTYTAPATPKATMITPTPGSTLTAASTAFTWTAATGATQYSLFFGSTPGASDLGIDLSSRDYLYGYPACQRRHSVRAALDIDRWGVAVYRL